MLKLFTNQISPVGDHDPTVFIGKITTNYELPEPARPKHILLVSDPEETLPEGFGSYFIPESKSHLLPKGTSVQSVFIISNDQDFLGDGDVVRLDRQRLGMRTLYRRKSNHNSFLVTERCNNFCVMCSQPPRDIDDSYIVDELLQTIRLMDREAKEIGITGGEPTLLGERFIELVKAMKNYLPSTVVHVLSNGRNFADLSFAGKVAEIKHPDLMIGIPLYSDVSNIHDYVVQADGAFDETIRGIINLKRWRQKVEVRVVIHKQTFERLPQLAMFIARNLRFVDHVALMGLEMMGFTRPNIEDLWIDPVEYQPQLVEAVRTLDKYGIRTSVYNHQLCLLDRQLWDFNVRSISDWKNEYMPECGTCTMKDKCGGFFSSAHFRYSKHIKPFAEVSK